MESQFTLFQSFPVEIRLQIWQEARPRNPEKALHVHRGQGCWQPFERIVDEDVLRSGGDYAKIGFSSRADLLSDKCWLEVPIFQTSREARSITPRWIREQNPH